MASGPEHDGVADHDDRFIKRPDGIHLGRVVRVEPLQFFPGFALDVQKTAFNGALVVMHPLQR